MDGHAKQVIALRVELLKGSQQTGHSVSCFLTGSLVCSSFSSTSSSSYLLPPLLRLHPQLPPQPLPPHLLLLIFVDFTSTSSSSPSSSSSVDFILNFLLISFDLTLISFTLIFLLVLLHPHPQHFLPHPLQLRRVPPRPPLQSFLLSSMGSISSIYSSIRL